MICSKTFPVNGSNEIGEKFDGSSLFQLLKNGISLAFLRYFGNGPASMHLLNNSCKGAVKQSEICFNEKQVQVIPIKVKIVLTVVDRVYWFIPRYRSQKIFTLVIYSNSTFCYELCFYFFPNL